MSQMHSKLLVRKKTSIILINPKVRSSYLQTIDQVAARVPVLLTIDILLGVIVERVKQTISSCLVERFALAFI